MRVIVREQDQQFDLCDPEVFKRAVHDNEELAVMVGQRGCPTCAAMRKVVRRLEGKIEPPFVEIDLVSKDDPCQRVADALRVEKVPTVVYFRGGKEAGRFVGEGEGLGDLEKALRGLLPVSG
jgi:thioredoxin-like negative regulator of GroEL